MKTYINLLVNQKDSVQHIVINRPAQLNALNKETIEELRTAIEEANAMSSVRVIILIGSGTKAFVAGADIKESNKNKSFNELDNKLLNILNNQELQNT